MEFKVNKQNIISQYAPMLASLRRNIWFKKAIQQSCKDKIVLDMGTGTGLLAHYALEAGAKFVYCIESEPTAARLADSILADCHDRSRFRVILCDFNRCNITDIITPRSIDVFVTETIAWALFDQGILETWKNARQLMNDNSVVIPDRITADLHVHDGDIDHDIPVNELYSATVLSKDYFAALEKHNQLDYLYTIPVMYDSLPRTSRVIKQVIDVDYLNSRRDIVINLTLPKPVSLSIIGYLHSSNMRFPLRMIDCENAGWKQVALIKVPYSGSIRITYQNNDFNKNHWLVEQIAV